MALRGLNGRATMAWGCGLRVGQVAARATGTGASVSPVVRSAAAQRSSGPRVVEPPPDQMGTVAVALDLVVGILTTHVDPPTSVGKAIRQARRPNSAGGSREPCAGIGYQAGPGPEPRPGVIESVGRLGWCWRSYNSLITSSAVATRPNLLACMSMASSWARWVLVAVQSSAMRVL